MRKFFALLLAVMLLVSFMAVPVLALQNVNGDNSGNNGSSPTPVVGEGQQKEFGNNDGPEVSEEPEPSETEAPQTEPPVTVPSESEPTEPQTSETEPAVTEAAATEPDPNTQLGKGQATVPTVPQETQPEVVEPEVTTEMFLLVALIAGLGAICVVLLIRRVLDL